MTLPERTGKPKAIRSRAQVAAKTAATGLSANLLPGQTKFFRVIAQQLTAPQYGKRALQNK
ncbi:hypothetical protein V1T76_07335 [Roseibium sp. FZY0029]|uniref:hypothetical protein n=1 Tax=Roseibium sp. FZY0029 TaxID=3116647 RepID=UPI002EA4957F|nr:hypothetical protein [Roseibium sp. FZY0029]